MFISKKNYEEDIVNTASEHYAMGYNAGFKNLAVIAKVKLNGAIDRSHEIAVITANIKMETLHELAMVMNDLHDMQFAHDTDMEFIRDQDLRIKNLTSANKAARNNYGKITGDNLSRMFPQTSSDTSTNITKKESYCVMRCTKSGDSAPITSDVTLDFALNICNENNAANNHSNFYYTVEVF